ncbi:MAG: sulfatase-like hydrolase/transferase [Opitutaceae bacterium]|nr:sulfatase-like hydrolase/transferase [Opitutaceae bacterium]
MRSTIRLLASGIFSFTLSCCPGWSADAAHKQAARRPNIVFVLLDDFGYADSGPYGAKDIRTPHMDRLAREGVRFTDFYANAPVCTPTRAGFITGRWQQRVGLEWAFGFTADSFRRRGTEWVRETDMHALGLPTTVPTLPQALKTAGYATGAFGKWHLGYRDEFNPVRRGFDEYFGELLGHSDYYTHTYYDGTYALRDGLERVKAEGYLTDLINRRAAEFVRKHAHEPFFLYVPHLAVHAPFQPPGRPKPSVTKSNMYDGDRRIYAAMVEKVDEGLGLILAELERAGVLDNTLVVLSSDNGGERYSDNSPLSHKKSTLWEGGIRVPCLMRWPARLPRGVVTPQVAITMDLSATFASIAGAPPQPGRPWDGIDLLPILTGHRAPEPRTLFWRIDRAGRQQKAVRHGAWKYLQDGNVEQLFDLNTDIGERRDLFFQRPEIFADLKARLAAWEAEMARETPEVLVK